MTYKKIEDLKVRKKKMKDFNKLIRKVTDAIEDATAYVENNKNIEEYLTETYIVDNDSDMKQYILKYIEDYYYNN